MNRGANKNIIRIIIMVLLIVLAIFISFVLLPKMYQMEGDTVDVIMLRQNVAEGTLIEADMVTTVTVGSYGISASVITNAADVVGQYATMSITTKELLFPEKFSATKSTGVVRAEEPEIDLADDQMLLTLELYSIAAGAAGYIHPGDIVNVAVYMKEGEPVQVVDPETGAVTIEEDRVLFDEALQGMTVYRVQTSYLTGINPDYEQLTSNTNERAPAYITLVCTQAQADLLLEYSYSSILHFVEAE